MKTLKRIVTGLAVFGVIGGSLYLYGTRDEVVTYVAPEYIEVEKEVVVNERTKKFAEREAELEEKYRNLQKLEARLDVLVAERDSIDAEIKEVRSELAGFTIGTQ